MLHFKQFSVLIMVFLNTSIFAQKTNEKVLFNDKNYSEITIIKKDDIDYINKTEVTYDFKNLYVGSKNEYFLVKNTKKTSGDIDNFTETKMKVEFYKDLNKKSPIIYNCTADKMEYLKDNIIFFTTYGCCGVANHREFYKFPSTNPFLKTDSYYYEIDIPRTKIRYFLGLNGFQRNYKEDNLEIAEMNVSLNGETPSVIKVIAKNETERSKINYISLDLIKADSSDLVVEDDEQKIMDAWSQKKVKNVNDINGIGIKIIIEPVEKSKKNKEYSFLFKNGELDLPKTLIVDFEEK
jgi:hypothetical protein